MRAKARSDVPGEPVNERVGRPRCIFCWSYAPLTREHPMSKRVLDLAGFTPEDTHFEIDVPFDQVTPEYVADHTRSIADQFVICVCAECNNGWMQNLDKSFASTVQRWVSKPTDRIGAAGLATIRRYLLKVLWVQGLGEAWASPDLIKDRQINSPFILNPKDGTRIKENELGQLAASVSLGAARVDASTIFTSALFNPTTRDLPKNAGINRASAGLVIALPRLQVQFWLVIRVMLHLKTQWPTGQVSWLTKNTTYGQITIGSTRPLIEGVELYSAGPVGETALSRR